MNNSLPHDVGDTVVNKKLGILIMLVVLVWILSACSEEPHQDEGSFSKDTLSVSLPDALAALALNETTLVVEVLVDAETPQDCDNLNSETLKACNNLVVDQVNGTFSCNIALSGGPHSIVLVNSINDATYNKVRVTAISGIEVNIVLGETTPADFSVTTLTFCDTDGDGINNLAELNAGTDPYTGLPDTPVATVEPLASALINGLTPIIITFDRPMDPATLSFSDSSLLHDGGIWSSGGIENNTLLISPETRWAEGPQTLSFNVRSSSGTELGLLTLDYTVDDTNPTATPNPTSGAAIQSNVPISISFSESIDIDAFTASGTLWDDSDQGVWSTNGYANDTLTINPTTTWANGLNDLIINASDLAGNLLTERFEYTVDITMPVASAEPRSGAVLMQETSIVITFTESMDPVLLNKTGSLWDESNPEIWSNTIFNNDTVTLSPATVWTLTGPSQVQTLTFDAADLFGNPLGTQTLTYTVGCPIGLSNCAGNCVDVSTDINHCGACGAACNAANASTNCSSGSCSISTCNAGFADCDFQYDSGCEITLASDTNNCGSCSVSCTDSVPCTNDSCSNSQCSNTPNDALCSDLVSDGACGGFTSTCDETGTFTRTITPRACSLTGCISGTLFTQTLSCTRNTDLIPCSTNPAEPAFCINGVCL